MHRQKTSDNNLGYLWMLQPVLFILSLHYLNYYPEHVINNVPNIMFWLNEKTGFLDYITSANLLLIISLTGILVLMWPALYIILRNSIGIFIVIWKLIIKIRDILEVFGYFLSYIIIVNGYKYEENGFYISMAGALSFVIVLVYSYCRHEKCLFDQIITFHIIVANINIPLAIYYNSSFPGLITVIAIHICITRSKISELLCSIMNLDKKDGLYQSVMVSSLAVPLFFLMRYFDHLTYLQPFIQPVYTMGTLVYLSILLFMTSNLFEYGKSFVKSQTIMILTLLIFACIGKLYNLESFTNSSMIYSILYTIGKIKMPNSCDTIVILLFMVSVILFTLSQFLSITLQSILSVANSILFI